MKNRLFVLVLVAVLAILVTVAIWQTLPKTTPNDTALATVDPYRISAIFSGWSAVDIQALRLDDPLTTKDILLTRNDAGVWTFGDSEESINQENASNIAKTVAFLPYTDILSGIPNEELMEYGLSVDSVWLQIQVILTTGEQHAITVGAQVPIEGGGYYALVDDRSDIYVLNRGAIDFLGNFLGTYQFTQ